MASTSKAAMAKSKQNQDEEFKTDWDLDYYHTDYESDEHWGLRRRFMEMHKNKFPEDRLVCLAQVFTNMEFMGCKYPSETMHLVAALSKEVAKDFRASRESKLKRTFMAASEAAESRAKGRRTTQQQQDGDGKTQWQKNKKRKAFGSGDIFQGLQFGKFVLMLTGGRGCICMSAQRCNMEYHEKELGERGDKKTVEIYIGGNFVSRATEETIKASKMSAFNSAMKKLQKNCYTIKQNPMRDTIKINKSSNNKLICGLTKPQSDTLDDKKLDATNKGYKMMKMMGWTGGGLGSDKQGREDPVGYLLKNNRAGLGNDACKLDRKYFTQMLKNYIDSDDIRELQFESTFTKDERAMLHEIAGKNNLKSTSYGKDESRRLVISKKNISNELILTEILLNKNVSYSDKYFVQVPESKANLYPDHSATLEIDM